MKYAGELEALFLSLSGLSWEGQEVGDAIDRLLECISCAGKEQRMEVNVGGGYITCMSLSNE